HPSYRHSWVYNNTLIKLDDAPNHQVVHYGGDSGKLAWYRQGTLHFFHNTVISRRTKRTTLFGLSSNAERVEAQNNLFYDRFGGSKLALCDGPGQFILDRNWFSTAWVTNHGFSNPTISGTETSLTGDLPGFTNEPLNNFLLLPNSPAIQSASPLPPTISSDHPIPNPKNLGASPPNQPPSPTTPPK
ncbi:MAG: hypothetical protein NTX04_00530, partial [Verrucomicrobia bacterium]|nr:hypothetical protein [Verrucomicrobiota bacterium]